MLSSFLTQAFINIVSPLTHLHLPLLVNSCSVSGQVVDETAKTFYTGKKDDLDAMHWAAEEMTEEHIDTKNNRVSDCRSKTVQVLPIAVAIMPVFQLNESLSPKSSSHSRKGER